MTNWSNNKLMVIVRNRSAGFTIVELLIVIVVIGILAGLVLNTFSGVQARARDTRDIDTVNKIARSLQAYATTNNTFPTYADLVDGSWQSTNSYNAELTVDSRKEVLKGLPGGTSLKVNIYMPLEETQDNCAVVLQVLRESDNTMFTKLIDDDCSPGPGFNAVPNGKNCPTTAASINFSAMMAEDTEGFCIKDPNIIL